MLTLPGAEGKTSRDGKAPALSQFWRRLSTPNLHSIHPARATVCPYSNKSCIPSRWLAALSSTTGFIHRLFSSSNTTQHGPPGLSHAHHRGCITNALGTRDRTPSHLCSHDRLTSVVVSVSSIGLVHTHAIGDDGENTQAIQSCSTSTKPIMVDRERPFRALISPSLVQSRTTCMALSTLRGSWQKKMHAHHRIYSGVLGCLDFNSQHCFVAVRCAALLRLDTALSLCLRTQRARLGRGWGFSSSVCAARSSALLSATSAIMTVDHGPR